MPLEINTVGDAAQESPQQYLQSGDSPDNQEWQKIKKELYNKIAELESGLADEKCKAVVLQNDLKLTIEERDSFKSQTQKLEKQLAKNLSKSPDQNDMVTKAKSVIFEKTKLCKNQELQIDALSQQVYSLKEIVAITKDMLEIRNMEVKQLHDKLDCMELKFVAEKDRHELMHTKLDKMIKLNAELKSEYQKQLELFTDLQKLYQQKQMATDTVKEFKKHER